MPTLTIDADRLALDDAWAGGISGHVEASAPVFNTPTGTTLGHAALTFDAAGVATVDLPATTGDLAELRYRLVLTYTLVPHGKVRTYVSGWFELADDAAFHDLATIGLPPSPDTAASKTALQAVADELSAHTAATTGAHPASAVSVTPGGLVLSTDVQAALVEVAGRAGDAQAAAEDALDGLVAHESAPLLHPITITGNPNGVVTAPVGSRAVNTEAGGWNGARVWRKDSGSGNTGWVVESGDTNIRALTADNGWTATGIWLCRIGDTVELAVLGLSGEAAISQNVLTLPPGFRIGAPTTRRSVAPLWESASFTGAAIGGFGVTGGSGSLVRASQVALAAFGNAVWITRDPWPTTLPGTPV